MNAGTTCQNCRKPLDREDFNRYCGAVVCGYCDHHQGLCRCFCGWTLTRGGDGYRELIEDGEQIEEDY